MLIINYQPLRFDEALNDENHPMHAYAEEYNKGVYNLRKKYPDGRITLKQSGFPKFIKGMNSKGVELDNIPEPVPPIQISLLANYSDPVRGKEHWGVCLGAPKPMAGGLWDIGAKRKIQMEATYTLDLVKDAELAYFLMYKSPQVLGKHVVPDDPREDAKVKGDRKRQALKIETAIWEVLSDDAQLRKVAQGYGVSFVEKKQPDEIRIELETMLHVNDEKKRRDPSVRGTQEFLEDLKITDYIRLASFLKSRIDAGFIKWFPDGKYKAGDKVIVHVPANDTNKRFEWLCNYYNAPNNGDKLKELLRDIVNKDYLDSLTDGKDFRWLAKVMDVDGYFNKQEEQVKSMVYTEFNV